MLLGSLSISIDIALLMGYIRSMNAASKARLFEEGGKIMSSLLKVAISRPKKKPTEEETEEITVGAETYTARVHPAAQPLKQSRSPIALPTSEETTTELKRRLARELYRAELDLVAGLKIANRPCDCLENKHTLMLEAASEELISQDPSNPVYQDVIQWIKDNQHKVSIEAIQSGKYAAEYPHMANEFKSFRKRVMGSVGTSEGADANFTLEQAKKMAAEEAAKEVERQWHSQ